MNDRQLQVYNKEAAIYQHAVIVHRPLFIILLLDGWCSTLLTNFYVKYVNYFRGGI